jgi:hypothetical protein
MDVPSFKLEDYEFRSGLNSGLIMNSAREARLRIVEPDIRGLK